MARLVGRIHTPSIYIDPPRYDDLRVPLTSTILGGANDPTFSVFRNNGAGSQGVFSWSFSNLVEQELFFVTQLPHSYKQGSDLFPHFHWSPSDAGAGNTVWGLEYTVQKPDGTPYPLTTILTAISAAAGAAFANQRATFPTINGKEFLISDLILGRIFRSTAGNTYAAAAFGHEVDFHFQMDSVGSNLQAQKTD